MVWQFYFFKKCTAIVADCVYYQTIIEGRTYYITNPNYPNNYSSKTSCEWHILSNVQIRITCDYFNIPKSENCIWDTFNIYYDNISKPRRYCGKGKFITESSSRNILITLTTSSNSSGGQFHCHFKAVNESNCSCGWKLPTKIVGGIETGINEYPMMAGILDALIKQVFCGGTIISSQHILTAAHCILNRKVHNLGVLVGDHDLMTSTETNATKLYRAINVIKHPLYSNYYREYDVAVITVFGKIEFTNEVGPACLPFQHHLDSFGGALVDVLGWGTTDFGGRVSNTLQMVKLSVLNFLTCRNNFQGIKYSQICTQAVNKDSCQFDSGGPVLWQNPTTRRLLHIGIISFGTSCAGFLPGVNVRVGSFIDWVVQVTPGAIYCQTE